MNKEQYLTKIEIATSLLKDMEMTQETKSNKRAVVKAIQGYLSSYAKYASLMVMFSLSGARDGEIVRLVDNPRRLTELQRYSDIGMCTCATLMSFTNATFFVVGVVNDIMDISDKSTNEKVVDIYKGISGTLAFTYLGARYAKKTYSHIVDPL